MTTSAGRCGESARRRSTVAAKLGGAEVDASSRVRCAARDAALGSSSSSSSIERAVAAAFAQRPQRALALVARGAVEDQDPVEVVDLVLEDPRLEPGGLERDRLAVDVEAA